MLLKGKLKEKRVFPLCLEETDFHCYSIHTCASGHVSVSICQGKNIFSNQSFLTEIVHLLKSVLFTFIANCYLLLTPTLLVPYIIDGSHSIFHHRNWRAEVSCDVDINQSAGSTVM